MSLLYILLSLFRHRLSGYQPAGFEMTTTNRKTYQDFRIKGLSPEKAQGYKPHVEPVQTKSLPCHFKTINQQELKRHKAATKQVDRIQYP